MEAPRPSRADVLTGTIAGRFSILKLLGAGGMGQVYQAEDTKLRRTVAIKRMAPRLQESESDRRRFLREAQQVSALNHPNVAGIFDVIEEQGETFLIMEFVEGTPLRAALQGGRAFTTEDFFHIASQGLEGLNAAHEKGILHGDIKPENIMLTPAGRVKVLDFGVARRFSLGSDNDATVTAATLSVIGGGTPAYMAPEVLTQKPYDGRADLFSMGVVCYEILGGQQPFETTSLAETMASVLHKDPLPLEELNPKVPAPVSSVIRTMLAKDPVQRYSTARDVLVDLRRVQQGQEPAFAQLTHAPQRVNRSSQWPRAWRVAGMIALIAATISVSVLAFRKMRKSTATPQSSNAEKTTTLVVLPVDSQTGDAKLTAFGNGLVETITAKLSQFGHNHPLQVVSAAELRQKGVTTVDQARQELGANTALHVRLEQSGDLVRVAYTLTDARNGKTLRAATIDAPVTDPFTMEDQLAQGVVSALGYTLKADELRELADHGTTVPEAYKYYTQARGYLEDAAKAENVDSAIILLQQALKADPNYGRAEADLGSAYWAKYDSSKDKSFIAKARQACSKAIDLGNSGAAGHVCLGVLGSGTGKYEEAVDQFQRAAELEPTNDDALVGLGKAYERLGKSTDAENTYKRFIQHRPTYWRGYNLLGIFYLRQAQYDDAAKMFQKVIDATPDSFLGYANMGAAYLYEAKYTEAIRPLEKSLSMHATADTYSNLGTAYYYQHRFKEAARVYEKALQMNDQDYTNWGNLGEAYSLDGEPSQAQGAFRKAVQLANRDLAITPSDPQILKNLAQYHAMLKDREAALKYSRQALEVSGFDKDALFAAALVYNQLGDTGQALEWLGKALRAGYSLKTILEQPDLQNLQKDPRFQNLVSSTTSATGAGK